MDVAIQQIPPLNLADGNTFFLDNSRYENFTACDRKGEYAIVRGRVSNETKQALVFGQAIHLAQKFRFRRGETNISLERETKQHIVLEKFWEKHPTPTGDYRTLGFAQDVVTKYNQHYPTEQFKIVNFDGRYLVEEGFTIPIGTVGNVNVVWTGRIDLAVQREDDSIWVVDHKTTSMGGAGYFTEYFNSSPIMGYVFALRHILGVPVKGAMINALVCRKATKTGKGIEFMRQWIEFEDDRIAEWQHNTLTLISDFLHNHDRNFFPMRTKQCAGRFGGCEYMGVCTMSPMSRLVELYGDAYKNDEWNPLHDDDVDLEAIENQPIPAGYQRINPADEAAKDNAMMNDVLKSLGLENI